MRDAIYAYPRLAAIYDPLDPDRTDLVPYLEMVDEFGATSVLDVGCGTGTFACLLAARGVEVVAVDPAAASIDVARTKSGASSVRWIYGDAASLPPLEVDLATMTGNVAQMFVADHEWSATLIGIRSALRAGGRFVFETRDPARRAWLEWDAERTHTTTDIHGAGIVSSWCDVVDVNGPLVTYRYTFAFEDDGAQIESESVLRFRDRDELARSLTSAGFRVADVRDAPDRPGREFVYVAEAM